MNVLSARHFSLAFLIAVFISYFPTNVQASPGGFMSRIRSDAHIRIIEAIDSKTDDILWHYQTAEPGYFETYEFGGLLLVLSYADSSLMAINPRSGKKVWFLKLENFRAFGFITQRNFYKIQALPGGGSFILDDRFVIRATDGKLLYSTPDYKSLRLSNNILLSSRKCAKGECLVLKRLQPDTGQELWTARVKHCGVYANRQSNKCIINNDDSITLAYKDTLARLDSSNGRIHWVRPLFEKGFSLQLGDTEVKAFGQKVAFLKYNSSSNDERKIKALYTKTGRDVWTYDLKPCDYFKAKKVCRRWRACRKICDKRVLSVEDNVYFYDGLNVLSSRAWGTGMPKVIWPPTGRNTEELEVRNIYSLDDGDVLLWVEKSSEVQSTFLRLGPDGTLRWRYREPGVVLLQPNGRDKDILLFESSVYDGKPTKERLLSHKMKRLNLSTGQILASPTELEDLKFGYVHQPFETSEIELWRWYSHATSEIIGHNSGGVSNQTVRITDGKIGTKKQNARSYSPWPNNMRIIAKPKKIAELDLKNGSIRPIDKLDPKLGLRASQHLFDETRILSFAKQGSMMRRVEWENQGDLKKLSESADTFEFQKFLTVIWHRNYSDIEREKLLRLAGQRILKKEVIVFDEYHCSLLSKSDEPGVGTEMLVKFIAEGDSRLVKSVLGCIKNSARALSAQKKVVIAQAISTNWAMLSSNSQRSLAAQALVALKQQKHKKLVSNYLKSVEERLASPSLSQQLEATKELRPLFSHSKTMWKPLLRLTEKLMSSGARCDDLSGVLEIVVELARQKKGSKDFISVVENYLVKWPECAVGEDDWRRVMVLRQISEALKYADKRRTAKYLVPIFLNNKRAKTVAHTATVIPLQIEMENVRKLLSSPHSEVKYLAVRSMLDQKLVDDSGQLVTRAFDYLVDPVSGCDPKVQSDPPYRAYNCEKQLSRLLEIYTKQTGDSVNDLVKSGTPEMLYRLSLALSRVSDKGSFKAAIRELSKAPYIRTRRIAIWLMWWDKPYIIWEKFVSKWFGGGSWVRGGATEVKLAQATQLI